MEKCCKKSKRTANILQWIAAMLLLVVLNTSSLFASKSHSPLPNEMQQATKVEGIVKDALGDALIGVSVVIEGTTTGTITDIDGRYTLNLTESKPTLVFSYMGYKTQKVVADKQIINITLQEDIHMMDEVVVVGYGIQKKANLTGAVASIDLGKSIESRPVADIGRALQGAVPGLTVTSRSGEIGSAPSIKIRGGVGSPNGDSNPLILVDNVEISDISLINPDDIESISVLKDAASSSIYGARAAFGVLLITTKSKNKNESFKINYSNNFAWRTPTKTPKQLPGWQQAEINLAGESRAGRNSYDVLNILVDQQGIDKMKEWEQLYGGLNLGSEMEYGRDFEYDAKGGLRMYRTWDWYDMFVKDWMPQQTHNLSMNGGNGTTNYNVTLGYLNQEGLTKINPDKYERYNAAASMNTQAYKWLNIRTNITFSKAKHKKPFVYGSDIYDHMYYLYRWQPMYPYGTYEGKPFRSALTELEQAPMTTRETDYWRAGAGATFKVIEGLNVDLDFMYSSTEFKNTKNGGPVSAYDIFSRTKTLAELENSYGNYISPSYDYAYDDRARREMLTTNLVATYTKKFNDHTFTAMAGSNLENSNYKYISAQRKGLYDSSKPELNLAYGEQTVSSNRSHWAVAGFFGRLNYAYKERYLLEVNGRYDGSSRFPKDERFGFFPSFSAGYRISEESFMESLKPYLSDMKARVSYGSIGNQDVGPNAFISTLPSNPKDSWLVGGKNSASMGTPTVVTERLTWEKVKTFDAGIDARFWDNKIGVTFDWYKRTTSDVLSSVSLPLTLGSTPPKTNFGELETPGWELAVDFNHEFSNGLRINLGAQITDYKTKVKKWSRSDANIPTYGGAGLGWYDVTNYYEGMTLGDIWGYKVDRILQENDFENGVLKPGIVDQSKLFGGLTLQPGDVLYKDLNGDDKIDDGKKLVSDSGDKTKLGNIFPRYEYGFNIGADYKGFDFNMFFQGVGKRSIWASGNQVLPGFSSGEPYYKGAEDYWTPENTGAFYPRPTIYGQANRWNYEVNDRYLLNMAYLRLKTLTIGYSLPRKLLQQIHVQNLRVYFTGENLLEFDNLDPEIDPETDIRYTKTETGALNQQDPRNFGRSYPYQRTISFGLQLTF